MSLVEADFLSFSLTNSRAVLGGIAVFWGGLSWLRVCLIGLCWCSIEETFSRCVFIGYDASPTGVAFGINSSLATGESGSAFVAGGWLLKTGTFSYSNCARGPWPGLVGN